VNKKGKLVIVGNAAHTMLPFAAQGASMVIEDLAYLAEYLARATSTGDFPKILEIFRKILQPRVESVANRSGETHEISHVPDGPTQEARDKHLKARSYYSTSWKWDKKLIDIAPLEMDAMYETYTRT
jgi:salicylate hydroxylase